MSTAEWEDAFTAATVGLAKMDATTVSYSESALRLRALIRTGLLRNTDLHTKPERFFLAHRILRLGEDPSRLHFASDAKCSFGINFYSIKRWGRSVR
jgi:hypothetical protein